MLLAARPRGPASLVFLAIIAISMYALYGIFSTHCVCPAVPRCECKPCMCPTAKQQSNTAKISTPTAGCPPIECPPCRVPPTSPCSSAEPQKPKTSFVAEKTASFVKIVLNDDRTRVIVWPIAPPTFRDCLSLVAAHWNLTKSFSQLRLWLKSGIEVKNQADYLQHLRTDQMENREVFITVGDEQYRPISGAFMYLFTEGKHGVVEYMIDSINSVEKNHNDKFGRYPIIIFYSVKESVVEHVMAMTKPKSRVYWVPVHQLHEVVLPDYPVYANSTFDKKIGYCAAMWRLPILQYFDYVVSIDADCAITHTSFDLFDQISRNDKILGYLHCGFDTACTQGMWEYAEEYVKSNNIKTYDWKAAIPKDINYSGSFLIFQTKFWTSNADVHRLFDHYDQSGNIFFRRWAEQSLFAIAAAMFAPPDKVFFMGGDFDVTHHRISQVRRPGCLGRPKPDCCDYDISAPVKY